MRMACSARSIIPTTGLYSTSPGRVLNLLIESPHMTFLDGSNCLHRRDGNADDRRTALFILNRDLSKGASGRSRLGGGAEIPCCSFAGPDRKCFEGCQRL